MSKTFYSKEFTSYRNDIKINPAKVELVFGSIINMDTNELRNVCLPKPYHYAHIEALVTFLFVKLFGLRSYLVTTPCDFY